MSMRESQSSRAEIRVITAAETIALRHAVLRAGRPVETAHLPGDDEATTRHFGAYREGRLLGVTSLIRAAMPEFAEEPGFQLRGMATSPEARGTGLGKMLVEAAIGFARDQGARVVWCNGRVSAAGFYGKLGFGIIGEEFETPYTGPHFRMMLRIAAPPKQCSAG